MEITERELFTALIPLLLVLHEKKVLDLSEATLAYEDALARRRLDQGEDAASTAFLQQLVRGLHCLAREVKGGGDTQQP